MKTKGKFSNLDLRVLDDDEMFEVLNNCVYMQVNFKYEINAGFVTDLASIPRGMRWWLKKTGKSRKPAVFHDHMIKTKWKSRRVADRMFKQMLIDVGMSKWKANLYYFGVSLGTWWLGDYSE